MRIATDIVNLGPSQYKILLSSTSWSQVIKTALKVLGFPFRECNIYIALFKQAASPFYMK
jgi:hypothetical protein